MPIRDLAELTWEEVRDLGRARPVAVWPVGALEAHGPHLPLATDVIIAEAMARAGAARLAADGLEVLVLPALAYTPAPFAEDFPGTLSTTPAALATLVTDIADSLDRMGARAFALANAHLDPTHLAALHAGVDRCREAGGMAVAFPDLTQRPWALRLGDEFRTGACHAGRFESSIVLAARPDLVRDDLRRALDPNPRSLSAAIQDGKQSFAEAGGDRAYFGWPADASAEEGRALIDALGGVLAEAVTACLSLETAA
jgi:creatinine amidohydrolase